MFSTKGGCAVQMNHLISAGGLSSVRASTSSMQMRMCINTNEDVHIFVLTDGVTCASTIDMTRLY